MSEIAECYGHEHRSAIKDHICCECKGTIQAGEIYHYHHGVWDGEASSYKVCRECEDLRVYADRDALHEECTWFGGLEETVCGGHGDDPELLMRFVAIKKMRGATVPQWMLEGRSMMEDAWKLVMRMNGFKDTVEELEDALKQLVRLRTACEEAARAFKSAGIGEHGN